MFNFHPPPSSPIYRVAADVIATAGTITVPPWLLFVQNANHVMVFVTTFLGMLYAGVRLYRTIRPKPGRIDEQ